MSMLKNATEKAISKAKEVFTPKRIQFMQMEAILNEAKARVGMANISNKELFSKLKDKEFKRTLLSKIEEVASEKGITNIKGRRIIDMAKRLEKIKEKIKIENISAMHIDKINAIYDEITKATGVKNPYALVREYKFNPNVRNKANSIVDKYLKNDNLDKDTQAIISRLKQNSKNDYLDFIKSIRNVHLFTLSGGEKARHLTFHITKQSGKYTIHAYIPVAHGVSSLSLLPMQAMMGYLPGVRNVSGPLSASLSGTSGIFHNMALNLENYAKARKEFKESQLASAS